MAITAAKLGTAIHDATDASSYAFASATYSNNKLYLAFVNLSIGTGTTPTASLSGGGLTWVEISPSGGATWSGAVRRMQVFRALVTSGATTGVVTITCNDAGSGTTATGCDAVILECDGMDTSGTNGSGAVVQSKAAGDSTSATSRTITFDAALGSGNRPFAAIGHRANEVTDHESGYTELDDGNHASPSTGFCCEWHSTSEDQTPSASWATNSTSGGMAVEIKLAAGGTTHAGEAALSALGTIAAVAVASLVGALALSAAGTIVPAAALIAVGSSILDGAGTLASAAVVVLAGVASLDSVGSLAASAVATFAGAGALACAATVAPSGVATLIGDSPLSAAGALVALGGLSVVGELALSAAASLSAQALVILGSDAALIAGSVVVAALVGTVAGACALVSTSTVIPGITDIRRPQIVLSFGSYTAQRLNEAALWAGAWRKRRSR